MTSTVAPLTFPARSLRYWPQIGAVLSSPALCMS